MPATSGNLFLLHVGQPLSPCQILIAYIDRASEVSS